MERCRRRETGPSRQPAGHRGSLTVRGVGHGRGQGPACRRTRSRWGRAHPGTAREPVECRATASGESSSSLTPPFLADGRARAVVVAGAPRAPGPSLRPAAGHRARRLHFLHGGVGKCHPGLTIRHLRAKVRIGAPPTERVGLCRHSISMKMHSPGQASAAWIDRWTCADRDPGQASRSRPGR